MSKKRFLNEIKRLESKKHPFQKYEGKFFNQDDWSVFILDEDFFTTLTFQNKKEPTPEERFVLSFEGSFEKCWKFLEQNNLISIEAEQFVPFNASVEQYAQAQEEYRKKMVQDCFEKGEFKTKKWGIFHETTYSCIGRYNELIR